MKRISASIVLALVMALTITVQAQQRNNPNTVPPYFTHAYHTGTAFANSGGDTTSAFKLGGTSKLSVVVIAYDSVSMDIYGDYQLVGGDGTWTQFLADSLIGTVDTLNIGEYVIRDNDTDGLDHIAVTVRIREVHRAAGNGVTSPTKNSTFIWKP